MARSGAGLTGLPRAAQGFARRDTEGDAPSGSSRKAWLNRMSLVAPRNAAAAAQHRFMTQDDGACGCCLRQMTATREALPHARLMVVAATPVIEAFGGGIETRYLCLDCGHTVMHSTGYFGSGWH